VFKRLLKISHAGNGPAGGIAGGVTYSSIIAGCQKTWRGLEAEIYCDLSQCDSSGSQPAWHMSLISALTSDISKGWMRPELGHTLARDTAGIWCNGRSGRDRLDGAVRTCLRSYNGEVDDAHHMVFPCAAMEVVRGSMRRWSVCVAF